MKRFKLKSKIITVLAILICSVFSVHNISFAKTSEEIAQDIANQQSELKKKQNDLTALSDSLASYQNAIDSSTGELPKLIAELEKAKIEADAKALELDVIKQAKDIKELERQQRQLDQQETLNNSYMQWRSAGNNLGQFVNTEYDYKKIEQYASSLTGAQQKNIFSIASDLKKIDSDIEAYDLKIKELEELKTNLAAKKEKLEAEIAYFNSALANGNIEASNLGASIQNIQQNIGGLIAAQQAAKQREDELLANPPAPTNPGVPVVGGFVFKSQGRDLYQGHGVGLSQWGAHGMGNAGYSYQNILSFYYTGVTIATGYEGSVINVQGYGNMNIEDYASGQGEIPAKACGNSSQVASRPDKYVLDNTNTAWDCWPEETIKAQLVAYRTYALMYAQRNGYICTTASCQVFNNNGASRWASNETKGVVLLYGGNYIEALYSADNNQGNGTANNDTIFQNLQGDGAPYAYLRAVNDAGVATNTYYTYWSVRTNQYNYDGVKNMILYNASTNYYDGSTKSYLNNIISDMGGTIASISFERDPSQRVKKVWFTGVNGVQRVLGGWWFKNLWNSWVADMGTNDYIYSQTIYLEAP